MELYIKQKLISIGDKYQVIDGAGNVVFKVKSRVISPFRHKKYMCDASDRTIMVLKRKILTLLPNVMVFDEQGNPLAMIKRKFSLRASFAITGFDTDLQITGDLLAWNFTISRNGVPVGSVSKKLFRIADAYTLFINNPQDAAFFSACVIAIDNLCHNNVR